MKNKKTNWFRVAVIIILLAILGIFLEGRFNTHKTVYKSGDILKVNNTTTMFIGATLEIDDMLTYGFIQFWNSKAGLQYKVGMITADELANYKVRVTDEKERRVMFGLDKLIGVETRTDSTAKDNTGE